MSAIDQMIVSYDSTKDQAKVTVNQQTVDAITVVVIQTDETGKTIGMAYGSASEAAKNKPKPKEVPNTTPTQYEFTMKLQVSANASGFVKNSNAEGYAFGLWGNGSVFSWPSDVVEVV